MSFQTCRARAVKANPVSIRHTFFQETVSTALERHKSVFVAFYDVSKAFDTVWTDGLFSKLYDMGIKGKCWWLFYRTYQDFNAKKSTILTYGEEPNKNLEYSLLRTFKLGNDRVLEKQNYDHVGVKACLYKGNNPRIEEKIIKARQAFNACAGLGIRKKWPYDVNLLLYLLGHCCTHCDFWR